MKIIDERLIDGVAEEAKRSPRLRMNYNFHQSLQDRCHRFLNALEPGTLIPVHHHPDKDETFVVLRGKVRVTTYDDSGEVVASCVLCRESGAYGVDIPKNVWHGVECLTPAVLLECKAGPFVEHEVDGILKIRRGESIYLAGGCFWGTEHFFKQIEGVVETAVGFANGHTANPTYEEVYTDTTGFAETVRVKYDPEVVSLEFLLQMFFKAIDPTSLNRQGHDVGTRYRTGIYFTDPKDLPVIEKVFAEEQEKWREPLAVEKLPLENFYAAEAYHQDYLDKNPTGYCHLPHSLFDFVKKASARHGSSEAGSTPSSSR
ncbi:MAG: peptide-methionine (S)-S-oxide reductase MsrA [Bacteroidales bacterium]|nr:peptide-methionine (S)-S-oxide reductase MsrA [Bacteroidales bacterium]